MAKLSYHWHPCRVKSKRKTIFRYARKYMPEHQNCNTQGYVYEHRHMMEKHLGRYLREGEEVHHKNGNTLDNQFSNLQLCQSHGEHRRIHRPPIYCRICGEIQAARGLCKAHYNRLYPTKKPCAHCHTPIRDNGKKNPIRICLRCYRKKMGYKLP